ncbi:universal stress protein [Mucilaginibacter kameinonensis]|uniref:universal stress protein n=1 Tax=Mucilaginibacter kameinonensis TaxID=452286 RepID=UPI0013CE8C0B|nr:universal stress protein [Mucilaginibacter kameinonensis]
MKKILIPIDFTPSAVNAAKYAAALTNDSDAREIVLMANAHVSQFEQFFPSPDFLPAQPDSQEEREDWLMNEFEQIRPDLKKALKDGVELYFKISRLPLLSSLQELVEHESPDLIVMGSNFNDETAAYIGDHLIKIAKASTIPVLIIPKKASYEGIREVLVPYNSNNANRLELVTKADVFINKPQLIFLKLKGEQDDLVELKGGLDTGQKNNAAFKDYHDIRNLNSDQEPLEGIRSFISDHPSQLIIAIPGEHGFFYHVTHHSVTAEITENSNIPVLILNANTGFGG